MTETPGNGMSPSMTVPETEMVPCAAELVLCDQELVVAPRSNNMLVQPMSCRIISQSSRKNVLPQWSIGWCTIQLRGLMYPA